MSFDLSDAKNIIDKSILLNGQLRQLEKSKLKDVKIDFVIHEPTDGKFQDAIDEAKAILNENDINKQLFTDLKIYSEQIVSHIALPS